jgi:hypothetical protein
MDQLKKFSLEQDATTELISIVLYCLRFVT